MSEYSISKRLIESYLYQPYSWFLNRHSADLGKSILSEVNLIVSNSLKPTMALIARILVAITLISLLIFTDPKMTLVIALTLGITYLLIFKLCQDFLNRIGIERLKNNQLRFTAVSEAFGAAKEIKVSGLEKSYISKFSEPAKNFAKNQASSEIISQVPRYGIEAIAFGAIILLILFLKSKTQNFNDVLPIITLYVFASYRLLPALQGIYSALTNINFSSAALNALYNDIKNLKSFNLDRDQDQEILSLNDSIKLKNIHYNYPNSSRTVIDNMNFTIPARTVVGIVGPTGCGQTTTVDIILGLLEPQKGTLEVDGQFITKKNLRCWQRSIGYVPQHIYLSDNTIANNIAFGIDSKDISHKLIEKVSKIANLHEFVTKELKNKYQTTVGERGVRLSGGQRQRIGIARALYHNPKLLILDEATSALDNQTEKVVMEAVDNIGKDTTIIMIAHRLDTVKKCDIIFHLEKGRLINQGTPEELLIK